MNENIDLTQILKDCPKGTKFYSSIHGELLYSWMYISSSASTIVFIHPNYTSMMNGTHITVEFYRDGRYYPNQGECTIFPSKDQRDWSKFTAPWYHAEPITEKSDKNNNVHFYVARDKRADILCLFMGKPIKKASEFIPSLYGTLITEADGFSNYGLNVRDFDNLKWEDEPVEVFINLEE